jgi:predicted NACHT family NTPase
VFATIGVILTILTIFVAIISVIVQVVTGMFPLSYLEDRRKQKLLKEKFSRGPYDKGTIERSTKNYIWPKCSNLDPAQEQEIRHALIATRESLLEKVNQFLDSDVNSSRRHLLILADSGMGKTSFVLNYFFQNSRRSKNKRHQIVVVPLGIKNPDELINQIPDQEDKIIFLDAFDEDVEAIKGHRQRIVDLMEKCKKFEKVIITCRTQFFPKWRRNSC